ncbi:NTP transferase domain-containing protein [Paenibacillus sp. ACRRX]|uniref:sugar phosphate nucleotidyltransferase n=1 Tax=unclassified Paenibacillus TaxID=185978 RepID=UPI001EF5D98F|nr:MULTISPECIES: sugar phosphate nucleotidyltransferase [unclassified Paenibacillus]MCG7405803.1 NTP transferase domain-containing protein [Paenibacillus sp. ACRRX]MDK8182248.1 sugar phosphate nucleotidyltransferase [Paenibacillus sp. UMB4589-SE434]
MKGLILCAGKGTRLQPFSNVTSKVLIPIANKPLLFYSIEKLLELGIQEIGIVIQQAHEPLFKSIIGDGERWGVSITYLYQAKALGIADAVKQAEGFIGSDPFILLLGDNLIDQTLTGLRDSILLEQHDGALLLGEVEKPQDYGIAEIKEQHIIRLEEKPLQPKSNLAIMGAYAFTSKIFEAVHAIVPSKRGEYEITDAIQWLIEANYAISYDITYESHTDVGTIDRWLEANRWVLQQMAGEGALLAGQIVDSANPQSPLVLIDPSSKLIECEIGPFTTIGPHVYLENCRIEDCIILEGVSLKNASLKGTIVSRDYWAQSTREA